MVTWSLIAEFQALILLCIIGSFFFEKKNLLTRRNKIFGATLLLAISSILLNVISVYLLREYRNVPEWILVVLNSLYFWVSVWVGTGIALYLIELLLEHVYRKSFQKKASAGLCLLNVGFLAAVVINVPTGILFWIDQQGYHRGPWNKLGYLVIALELAIILLGSLRYQLSASPRVLRMIRILPLLLLFLIIYQIIYPEVLLNGTIMAVVMLIFYLRFQNYQVEKDFLTNLGNRKTFCEELRLKIRSHQHFQIIFVTLHEFKQVNQLLGHKRGDAFLYLIGKWMNTLDPVSNAYRFSNVSFVILYPYQSPELAERHIEQVAERFQKPWELGEIQYEFRASCCNLIWEGQLWSVDTVVEYLETVQMIVKKHPRRILEFTEKTEQKILFRKWLKIQLEEAIAKKKFELYFQPIYDCRKKAYTSAEVLLRLKDENGSFISPEVFIPYAEEIGLVEDISWIVLEKTCCFLEKNQGLPLEALSMNISMRQFQDIRVAERILAELNCHHLSGNRLIIEITERELARDRKQVQDIMELLTRTGVRFYLDDFGTGYSNYSMVMHLPFTCIKLDRSLLEEVTDNEKDRRMIRIMVELFQDSGFEVIGEGIENEKQANLLQELGTDFLQGFYYAKPMPEADFIRFVTLQNPLPTGRKNMQ